MSKRLLSSSLENNTHSQLCVENIHNAGSYYEILNQVVGCGDVWVQCDVLLCCKTLERYLKPFFLDKVFITLESHELLDLDMVTFTKGKRAKSIGVVSPFLAYDIFKHANGIDLLRSNVKEYICFMYPMQSQVTSDAMRKFFHYVGFYEVVKIVPDGYDDLSVGCTSDGEFLCFSQSPGFSDASLYQVFCAFRVAQVSLAKLPWKNIYLDRIKKDWDGFGVDKGVFALSITQKNSVFSDIVKDSMIISADLSWGETGAGHASLVCCYKGPLDENMYACLFQVGALPTVSLWVNNGSWLQLAVQPVPQALILVAQGKSTVRLWMKVEMSKVIIGSGEHIIITENNDVLERVPVYGIRICDDTIRVDNIELNTDSVVVSYG